MPKSTHVPDNPRRTIGGVERVILATVVRRDASAWWSVLGFVLCCFLRNSESEGSSTEEAAEPDTQQSSCMLFNNSNLATLQTAHQNNGGETKGIQPRTPPRLMQIDHFACPNIPDKRRWRGGEFEAVPLLPHWWCCSLRKKTVKVSPKGGGGNNGRQQETLPTPGSSDISRYEMITLVRDTFVAWHGVPPTKTVAAPHFSNLLAQHSYFIFGGKVPPPRKCDSVSNERRKNNTTPPSKSGSRNTYKRITPTNTKTCGSRYRL